MPNRPTDDPKRHQFAVEYLVDKNAKEAAIRCGVPPKAAKVTGCRWLKRPEVRAEVDRLLDEQAQRTKITADNVLIELARLAMIDTTVAMNVKAIKDLRKLPPEVRRSIQSYKFKNGKLAELKFCSKVEALHLLGKHLKLFVERLAHEDPNGNPLAAAQIPALAAMSMKQLIDLVEKLK